MRTCTVILILSSAFLGACKEGTLKLSVDKENGNTVIALKTQANRLEGKWECAQSGPWEGGPKGATAIAVFDAEFLPNLHVNRKGKIAFNKTYLFKFEETCSFEIRKDRLCTVVTHFSAKPLNTKTKARNLLSNFEKQNSPGTSSCIDIVKLKKSKLELVEGEKRTTCTR